MGGMRREVQGNDVGRALAGIGSGGMGGNWERMTACHAAMIGAMAA
jgi:hypothetical protein